MWYRWRVSPIFILGMHRSGTSCLAALLGAAGARVPGHSLRNWDNPRGHHEAADLVRLNEDVLAHSGGHWLRAPTEVRWTEAQAAERDRLLALPGPTLWKDPRTLLVLPFWQAAPQPIRYVGIVRHPRAVADSLRAWRGMPVDEALALWLAHAERLASAGAPVLCFDAQKVDFIREVTRIASELGLEPEGIESAYVDELVHHGAPSGPTGDPDLLAACEALYMSLIASGCPPGTAGPQGTQRFPWPQVEACIAALAGHDTVAALDATRAALAGALDPAAVMAPIAAACLKHHGQVLLDLLDTITLPPALAGLLRGKALLALHRPHEAAQALQAACAVPAPLYEARHLLPVALWDAGQPDAAEAALVELLPTALYPFRLHARRAEWAWSRGEREAAFTHLATALETAPHWRHGRLLHRRAAWRMALGDATGAAEDRRLAAERDPSWHR